MTIIKLEEIGYKKFIDDPELTDDNRLILLNSGVDTIDISKNKDYYIREIEALKTFCNKYGLIIDEEQQQTLEIMMATYVMPHNDDDFLKEKDEYEDSKREYQLLIPISIPEDGYDIYTVDLQTREIIKTTSEINKPMVLDYRNIHFALPTNLNKAEQNVLNVIFEELNRIDLTDLQISHLVNFEKTVLKAKATSPEIRWNDIADIQFLAGRVYGPNNIYDIKAKPKLKKKLKR